jgi:integrase
MVLEKLREHMNQQQLVRQFAGDRWQENDLVFPSSIGTPMEWWNMVRDSKDTLQRSGLPNIRFHDLRHKPATLMLK